MSSTHDVNAFGGDDYAPEPFKVLGYVEITNVNSYAYGEILPVIKVYTDSSSDNEAILVVLHQCVEQAFFAHEVKWLP